MEEKTYPDEKSLIEKARNNPSIIDICYHEYLGDYGEPPPEGWKPSDDDIIAVIARIGWKNI